MALDFVNTQVKNHDEPVDLLTDFNQLTVWLTQAHLFDDIAMQAARQTWGNATAGSTLLKQSREFRQVIRQMIDRIIHQNVIETETIEAINTLLETRAGHLQLVADKEGYKTQFYYQATRPLHLLAPIAEATAHFLDSATLSRLKQCGNPDCIRYFYDSTKNRSRRWCSMEGCGNRMKVAAYYARKRNATT
ncbi:MAG: CGNR zinc finger domain-containing protein [Chloroflexota bacterium]